MVTFGQQPSAEEKFGNIPYMSASEMDRLATNKLSF
jgi:hypothetical protein